MSAPKIKAVLYKNKTYSDGTHPIMIRITKDRKTSYKGVGFSVKAEAWDEDNQKVFEKKPQLSKGQERQLNPARLSELKNRYKEAIILSNAEHINATIDDCIKQAHSISQKLKVNEETIDAKVVKSKLSGDKSPDKKKSFITYATIFSERFLKQNSIGTHRRYTAILSKVKVFTRNKDLTFAEVTPAFLEDFQRHLLTLGNKTNTIQTNLKAIRAIYYAAIAEQIISVEKNPFFVFKIKGDASVKKEKLTLGEIVAIENLDVSTEPLLRHCQMFFLCSFYCAGVRASDMLLLKKGNIKPNGRLDYIMEKTGAYKSIAIIPKAKAIFDEYNKDKSPDDYIFPFMTGLDETDAKAKFRRIASSTAVINKYLKQVAAKANISKNLSTHIARHSFSDIARQRKASIYDISKMLGHSSIKITEAYLASLDLDSQDETLKQVLDF